MKRSLSIICAVLIVMSVVSLTGCKKIISESPAVEAIVEVKSGDIKRFQVSVSRERINDKFVWTISIGSGLPITVSEDRENIYDLRVNDFSLVTNRLNIKCEYYSYEPAIACFDDMCFPLMQWVLKDSRQWNVRIRKDTAPILSGNYYIYDETDLQLLKDYTMVTGSLVINSGLESLTGLENLNEIGNMLNVSMNEKITDLSGLQNLRKIGGYVYITLNHALESIESLSNLQSAESIHIYNNIKLLDLSGLENITSVKNGVYIQDNTSLKSLTGLHNLVSAGRDIQVYCNSSLKDLAGLASLQTIGGDLWIAGNESLTTIADLHNLLSVGGTLKVDYNDLLTDLTGLDNLTSIRGINIMWNKSLMSLAGLQNITKISNSLVLENNSSLADISQLQNVTTVGNKLLVTRIHKLTDLSGLRNVASVNTLEIYCNDGLTSLGMSALQRVDDRFYISDNDMLCQSLAEELRDQVLSRGGIGGNIDIRDNKECPVP